MTVMEPADDKELRFMFELALAHNGPVAIRYPRGSAKSLLPDPASRLSFGIGEAEIIREGKDVVVFALGNTVYAALSAASRLEKEGVSTMVVNSRFVKPLDRNLISSVASVVPRIITVEENTREGGFGSAVLELLNDLEVPHVRVKRLGIPDAFIEQGQQKELRKKYGLDEEGIYLSVLSILKEPTCTF